jgi:hypothetical protein
MFCIKTGQLLILWAQIRIDQCFFLGRFRLKFIFEIMLFTMFLAISLPEFIFDLAAGAYPGQNVSPLNLRQIKPRVSISLILQPSLGFFGTAGSISHSSKHDRCSQTVQDLI